MPIERFVIGIGLNLLAPRDPEDRIGQPATGLFESAASPVSGELVIGRVAAAVVQAVALFLEKGLLPFRDGWDRFDALRGEQVALLEEGRIQALGIARGIDGSGALRLETATGMQAVTSGDVSVRAVHPARGRAS
jgi:BirA family biotin operon repressor/biotin-[acetyl-CoA-carboxylase] ligase